MTGPTASREDWEAFWDGEENIPRRSGWLGLTIAASVGAALAAWVWHERGQHRDRRRVIPSAADIHVRPPPPR